MQTESLDVVYLPADPRAGIQQHVCILCDQGSQGSRRFSERPVSGRKPEALLELDTDDPHRVFGSPDDLKLLSCMTLFEAAEGRGGVFTRVIEKYYKGRRDRKTVEILERE